MILDQIGLTPLVPLRMDPRVLVKGERPNPGGSVKDRIAKASSTVEGIGASDAPANLHRDVIDEAERISDDESFAVAARLIREEGLLVMTAGPDDAVICQGASSEPEPEANGEPGSGSSSNLIPAFGVRA